MNKTILKNAKIAIDNYKSLDKDKYFRFREGSHHQINVKRYNDDVNIDDILSNNACIEFKQELQDKFDDDYIYRVYWDYLNYEVECLLDGDIPEKDYKHLSNFCQRGRSGGYITFDDDNESIYDELSQWLNELECNEIEYDDYKDDIIEHTETLNDTVKEVINAIDFIDKYNKSINWKNQLMYYINDELSTLKDDKNKQINNISVFKNDIELIIKDLSKRLNIFEGDKTLKNNINRNLKSIKKIIE